MDPVSPALLVATTVSLVAGVRARLRLPDGSDRIAGPWVVVFACVAFALVYLGARFLPGEWATIAGALINIIGAPALATDVAKAARPASVSSLASPIVVAPDADATPTPVAKDGAS